MPKVTNAHSQSRRRQILEAAIDCFSKQGFSHTTMRDIVKKSGLSTGAIYQYFESKDAIVEEIAKERHDRERDIIIRAGDQVSVRDFLASLAEGFFGALRDKNERKMRRLGVQLWAEALRNPKLLAIARRGIARPRKMLSRAIQRAQQAGEFPAGLEPDAAARVLIALFHGFILQQSWDHSTRLEPFLAVARAAFEA